MLLACHPICSMSTTWFFSCLAMVTNLKYLDLTFRRGLPEIHTGKAISRLSGYQIWLAANFDGEAPALSVP
ncbi:hypothetical protein BDV12DRAFT_168751 [Aspergillus spectabilis]